MAMSSVPKGLTRSENRAYHWLKAQGVKVLRFNRAGTPDFETDKGFYEVKRPSGSRTLTFTFGQIEKILATNAKVLVFTESREEPITVIEASELDKPVAKGFVIKTIQLTSLHITITEEGTQELIRKYTEWLGMTPSSVVALAMRENLPELPRSRQ